MMKMRCENCIEIIQIMYIAAILILQRFFAVNPSHPFKKIAGKIGSEKSKRSETILKQFPEVKSLVRQNINTTKNVSHKNSRDKIPVVSTVHDAGR